MKLGCTRLAAGIAAAALPLALLAGCGEDEPQPKFDEPTSELPSASPSPSGPVEPTPPAAMKGDDVEAAEAFATYYFQLLDYAKFSGDTDLAKSLALQSCLACAGATDSIDAVHTAGGTYEGGELEVVQSRMSELGRVRGNTPFRGVITVRTAREVVSGSGDKEIDGVYPGSRIRIEFVAVNTADGWRVGEWQQI